MSPPSMSEQGIPNLGMQSKAETRVGLWKEPPHLQAAVIRASGPLRPGRAGPGRLWGAAVLLQPLQEEVINSRKVVIAAVLQGLRQAEKRVRARPEEMAEKQASRVQVAPRAISSSR